MTDVSLRGISISDFRRLEGNRVFALDAPIVLLHGPNGTGKTSVLSALELALTGEVRSMRRHDQRYTAHLPFHGQEFATLRVEVSERLVGGREPERMTVGGSRIDGAPALNREAAQFYAERCYLDQTSLGQLLELYQYREGKEESALARFVNELLGLEQLDALRSGLSDATDFRRLKKLSESLADAETAAKQAGTDLSQATKENQAARADLTHTREQLLQAMQALGHDLQNVDDASIGTEVAKLLRANEATEMFSAARDLENTLIALGGRIEGLSSRPSMKRLEESKAVAVRAREAYQRWREEHESTIQQWRADAIDLELPEQDDQPAALGEEVRQLDLRISRHRRLAAEVQGMEAKLATDREALADFEAKLANAREQAGSLAEGLAAMREHSSDNVCPVCDRDFGEVSSTNLTHHIDRKVAELTSQGVRLQELRQQTKLVRAEVQRGEQALEEMHGQLLTRSQQEAVTARRSALLSLHTRLQDLQPTIDAGMELESNARRAQAEPDNLEAVEREAQMVWSELETAAQLLGHPAPDLTQPLKQVWQRLADAAAERVRQMDARQAAYASARDYLDEMLRHHQRVKEFKNTVTQTAERKLGWEGRVEEARRRQEIARKVRKAASDARAAIVQRVFTESLNDVWRSVFLRLAPREPFVPAFGIPTSSKTALELTLQTVHPSGKASGPPQMMLSAGNLNTAALSLFIALHLAVDPLVPCLVFDDPVQSMDEVHIAQFAGLMRVLSKHHGRQIIIAVHERELFEYLALELSPAYDGDELITIELGTRSADDDGGVRRLVWTPDDAIAV